MAADCTTAAQAHYSSGTNTWSSSFHSSSYSVNSNMRHRAATSNGRKPCNTFPCNFTDGIVPQAPGLTCIPDVHCSIPAACSDMFPIRCPVTAQQVLFKAVLKPIKCPLAPASKASTSPAAAASSATPTVKDSHPKLTSIWVASWRARICLTSLLSESSPQALHTKY
jgi:hypothetical protein